MKDIRFMVAAITVGWAMFSPGAVSLIAPKEGETMCQLRPAQLKFVKQTKEQRDRYFDGKDFAHSMRQDGSTPMPIELEWTGDSKEYMVSVKRLPDGKVFFSASVPSNRVEVDSLEIARTWEWSVTAGGETAKGTFKTEDRVPRLIRIQGVSNARDVGGRIGLDGRRIRQGLVFRTSGLNNNAPQEYYALNEVESLYKEGKLKGMGHSGRKLAKKLKAGEKLTESMIKKERFIKRKCFAPGKKRLTEEERLRLLREYGFKSDIDLRSDDECYGMTGSPLGPDVKWWHISYSGYAGAFGDAGKRINHNVFKVFTDAKNYPIVFHCIGGADRTGTVGMILEALLGVEEDELWKDYLTTGFVGVVSDRRHQQSFGGTLDSLKKYPGTTLTEKAEAYMLDIGLTKNEIAFIRDYLLGK